MLCRMALKNIRKSFRDYAIYFFTLVIGVSVFYVFNAIETQTSFLVISHDEREMAEILGTVLSSLSVFVAVVLGLLIVFASRFLMKRRNKEFATYLLLGMSKGNIAVIMFIETAIIGLVSLVIGLLIGIGLSQLMSAVVANLFEADMSSFKFIISTSAILKTILNFAVIYVIVIVFDTIMVGKTKLINLIQSARRSEKVRLKNPVLCTIVFIISAVVLGYAYHIVLSKKLGIASLEMHELALAIALGAISTFFIFWSVSGLLLRIVMFLRRTYFRKLNSFTIRQLSSSINTMVFSMTIICLLLFFTISGLSAAYSLRNTLNRNLTKYAPNDIFCGIVVNEEIALAMEGTVDIVNDYYVDEEDPEDNDYSVYIDSKVTEGKTPYEIWQMAGTGSDEGLDSLAAKMAEYNNWKIYDEVLSGCEDYFTKKVIFNTYYAPGLTPEETLGSEYDKLIAEEDITDFEGVFDHEQLMKLSDYNALAELRNYKKLELAEDEYAILANSSKAIDIRNKAMNAGTAFEVYGKILRPKNGKCIEGCIDLSSSADNGGVIIVPDAVIDAAGDKALVAEMMFSADYNTKLDLTEEEMEKPIKTGLFNRRYDDTGVFLRGMILGTKREIYISSIGFGAMATFLALYLGIVFLITSAVILALKALSDSLDSLDRYDMLRRLGADEKDINGSLLRQQGIFFLLPMMLAVFHSIFGIKFINKTLVIFGEYHILGSIVFTALIIGLIYGGYFLITYTCSRQIIKGRK